ncbi:MAG: sugar/nucleoside kinase (ribokinase family) [Rubritalea sp.]|jgi:sugar/nucleoside kinase (ribokinase family)
MSVIIGGTIAIDNVKTPKAEAKKLLGGSASFASLAASYYTDQVNLVGIIGHDYPQKHLEMLESHGVILTGVERSDSESFTWTGEYMENMNDRETHAVALNVLEGWEVKVPTSISGAELVVLANMSPENQLQMLSQCDGANKFVIADTMDLWITIANEQLHEVLSKIDLLVLNESEARDLARTSNLILAGEVLLEKGPKHVIIKLGEFGAVLFGPDDKMFRLHAWPLKEVADPTGAGDSFLGGMAGYLDDLETDQFSFDDICQSMARGSVAASYTCEAFSTLRLQEITKEDLSNRLGALRELGQW